MDAANRAIRNENQLVVGSGRHERCLDDPLGLLNDYTTDDGLRYLDYELISDADHLVPDDLAVTILINSRVNGRAFKSVQDRAHALPLANLPKVPLEQSDSDLRQQTAELIAEMAQWPGFAAAVSTKVLHKKRPHTIPILDNQAIFGAYMNPKWPEYERSRQDSVYGTGRIRDALEWIYSDLVDLRNRQAWSLLEAMAPKRTRIEIFDMVWWSYFRRTEPVTRGVI